MIVVDGSGEAVDVARSTRYSPASPRLSDPDAIRLIRDMVLDRLHSAGFAPRDIERVAPLVAASLSISERQIFRRLARVKAGRRMMGGGRAAS